MTREQFLEKLNQRITYAAARVGAEVTEELKKVLSVPAPIVPGSNPLRAATKATPGAPPRKLTGRGRAAVSYFVETHEDKVILYVGNNVIYMGVHERGNHPWLLKTIQRMMPKILLNFQRYLTM